MQYKPLWKKATSLRTVMKQFRSIEVNYTFLRQLFDDYVLFEKHDNLEAFERIKVSCIPFANAFLSKSDKRFSFTGGNEVYEELFSWAYETLVDDLSKKRLIFENEKRMYAYFDKRIVLGMYTHYRKSFYDYNNSTVSIEGEKINLEEISHEFQYTTPQSSINEDLFLTHIRTLSSHFSLEEKPIISHLIVTLYSNCDEGRLKPREVIQIFKDNNWFYTRQKCLAIYTKALVCFRCSLALASREDLKEFSPVTMKSNKDGDVRMILDKFFLQLVQLEDKYPGFSDLYYVFGPEKIMDMVSILGGRTVSIPRHKDFLKMNKEVEIFIYAMTNREFNVNKLSSHFHVTEVVVRKALANQAQKFMNIPMFKDMIPRALTNLVENSTDLDDGEEESSPEEVLPFIISTSNTESEEDL